MDTIPAIRQFLRRTWVFFILYGLWLGLAMLLVALTDKRDLHLTLNGLNVLGNDTFFEWASYLGDRRVAWFFGISLCFKQVRRGAAVLSASIGAGLLTELLKYQVFGHVPRPVAYFGEPSPLYLVPGFENHLDYSMPSGHAAIAFALFTSLAIQERKRWEQVCLLAMGLLAAYSRVYLSEHFLGDVVVGSLLGVACALVAHAIVRPAVEAAAPEVDEVDTTD